MRIIYSLSAALLTGLIMTNLSCNQESSTTYKTHEVVDSASLLFSTRDSVQAATPDSTFLLGVWYDDKIKAPDGANIAYQVITDKNRVFIQPVAFKGKKLQVSDAPVIQPTATELIKQGDRYITKDSPEDSYLVDKDGNLLIYHNNELLVTCKKIL